MKINPVLGIHAILKFFMNKIAIKIDLKLYTQKIPSSKIFGIEFGRNQSKGSHAIYLQRERQYRRSSIERRRFFKAYGVKKRYGNDSRSRCELVCPGLSAERKIAPASKRELVKILTPDASRSTPSTDRSWMQHSPFGGVSLPRVHESSECFTEGFQTDRWKENDCRGTLTKSVEVSTCSNEENLDNDLLQSAPFESLNTYLTSSELLSGILDD